MTLEQLLTPEVMTWESKFKETHENYDQMSAAEIDEEFDKWLIANEDLINKSVEDNIDEINEAIELGASRRLHVLNEGSIFDDMLADDDDDSLKAHADDKDEDEDEDEPITGEVEGEEPSKGTEFVDDDETTITGVKKLINSEKYPKKDIFRAINSLYARAENKHWLDQPFKAEFRKMDVSEVTNMAALFAFTKWPNIDLSTWNTENVKNMEGMFYRSDFNNDSICGWNVSSCTNFRNMFTHCPFNQVINKWTPGFVEKDDPSTGGKVSVRADLPLVGAFDDEAMERLERYWDGVFTQMELEDLDDDTKEEDTSMKESKLNHVIDYDTFITEGKFRDFINKGVDKVKEVFKSISLKFNDIVAFFKDNGELLPVTSAYTSLNVAGSGKIEGVTAFCNVDNDLLNDSVKKSASIVEEPGYYGIIDKGSVEYENYLTFSNMINEHYEKYGNIGCFQMINEGVATDGGENDRVGFHGSDAGLQGVPDITSKQFKKFLTDAIKNVPAYKGQNAGGTYLIWGAPGIGKSSIPKTVIKEWNTGKDAYKQKALMVVECGNLTTDGFTLPIPVDKTVEEYLSSKPRVFELIKKSGISTDTIETIKTHMHKVSTEAPKTWLPCYFLTPDQDEVDMMNAIANGHVMSTYDKHNRLRVTETTEGGILLLDEFFRADPAIFKILMQLCLNRNYNNEFVLGDKWAIVCCSNRPYDDDEVKKGFKKTGAVLGTRFLAGQYNFIPDFNDWKNWAVDEGHFDDVTLEFLMHDEDANGEYTNWHTIRPGEYTEGKTGWPTPRTWSALMNELYLIMENDGYADIYEIPEDDIRLKAKAIIGEETAERYISFLKAHAKENVDVKKIINTPDYKIPTEFKCSVVVKKIESAMKTMYSPDNTPTLEQMMNLYNCLNNNYTKASLDNFIKEMHVDLVQFFDVLKNKPLMKAWLPYLNAAAERYSLSMDDFKKK